MPHSGSAFNTSSNACCDARYQNECWYSIARLNSFCASGLHDVSKFTLPSFLSSDCPNAGCASESPAAAAAAIANDVLIMIQLLVSIGFRPSVEHFPAKCETVRRRKCDISKESRACPNSSRTGHALAEHCGNHSRLTMHFPHRYAKVAENRLWCEVVQSRCCRGLSAMSTLDPASQAHRDPTGGEIPRRRCRRTWYVLLAGSAAICPSRSNSNCLLRSLASVRARS